LKELYILTIICEKKRSKEFKGIENYFQIDKSNFSQVAYEHESLLEKLNCRYKIWSQKNNSKF